MGYSRLTLRFNSPQMEAAFLLRKKGALVRRLKVVGGITATVGALGLVADLLTGVFSRSKCPTEIGYVAARGKLVGYTFFMGLDTLVLLALSVRRFVRNLLPSTLELIATVIMILNMLSLLTLPSYMVKILGSSVKEAFGEERFASDTHLLLILNALISAAHVGLPLRWCSLFHIEIVGILLYAMIAFVIGSNEPPFFSGFSLILLTAIVVITAFGKRGIEAGERQAFMEIINEKSLRCQAEYELHLGQVDRGKRREAVEAADAQSQRRSDPGSVPTTAPSNKIFDPSYHEEDGVPKQLAGIADLGEGEHWLISAADVKLKRDAVLGVGGFGKVVAGYFSGVAVAVKLPHDRLEESDLRALPDLCNELRVLRHLRHPNIVALHGAVISPRDCRLAIVLELVHGTLLKDVVESGWGGRLDIAARCRLMLGVCNALLYLHSRRPQVVHGDLKSRNVMVVPAGDSLTPKLLDFGLSRVITRRAKRLGGTLRWMAPELCQADAPVKCSSDVYSFGRLIVYIANGSEPMPKMKSEQIRRVLKQGKPPPAFWPVECAFKPVCKALVEECIRAQEDDRPHIAGVHHRLAAVPRELGITETHGHVFEDLELASEDLGSDDLVSEALAAHDAPAHGTEAAGDGEPQEPPQGERLCPLPEGEPLGAAAQAAMPPEDPEGEGEKPRSSVEEALPWEGSIGAPSTGGRGSVTPPPPSPEVEVIETTMGAMELTLLRAVARWRISRPTRFTCCERHAALDLAQMICNVPLSWPCVAEPLPRYSSQCLSCGVLGVHRGTCDVCECSVTGTEGGQRASL